MEHRLIHALVNNADKFHTLAEALPQLIWITDPDGNAYYYNQKWYSYTDTTFEQVEGLGWTNYVHPDDRPHVRQVWLASVEAGVSYEVEYRLRNRQTGEYRWVLARGLPLKDEHGHIQSWFGTCTDIDDNKRIEETLRISELRFRKLFESNIIGVLIARMNGVILVVNDAFLQLTGYSREEIITGLRKHQFLVHESDINYRKAIRELFATGGMTPKEVELRRKDGSHISVLVGVTLLDQIQKTAILYVLDVSEKRELERRKDFFISLASHELKTPLTNLKLLSQQLIRKHRKGQLQDPEKYFAQMEAQVDQLTWLVNDLLDISKIQAGQFEYVEEIFDLDELVKEVVTSEQRATMSHKLCIRGKTDVNISGDRKRLGQVISNILNNAIKYSPQADRVLIILSVSADEATISIQDYGMGISKAHQKQIFEQFYRVHTKKETGISGMGIGLFISSEIVRFQGGAIALESREGEGSTFTVTLPIKR